MSLWVKGVFLWLAWTAWTWVFNSYLGGRIPIVDSAYFGGIGMIVGAILGAEHVVNSKKKDPENG